MEEKKTKKIDLVVIMAILILIAFIGVMSFAMVQGIIQHTKKDVVAYADAVDTPPLNDNLLRTYTTAYSGSYSSTGLVGQAYSFASRNYSYTADSSLYTLYYAWVYNNTSAAAVFNSNKRDSGNWVSITTDVNINHYLGVGFPTSHTCPSGDYTLALEIVFSSGTSYDLVDVCFYDSDNNSFTWLAQDVRVNDGTLAFINFTSSVDFDDILVRVRSYNTSNALISKANSFYFAYLRSGTYSSFGLSNIVYENAYTAGYYTGYAVASPSDDDDFQLDYVGNNLLEYQFNQLWDDTYAKLVRNGDTYKGWQVHSSGSAMYNYDEVNSYSIFKYYGSSVSYNYDFYYYLDDFDSGDYTFTFNYDYGDIDAHDFKLLALMFTIPETDPVSEETLAYIQDDNLDVTLTATYYQGRYLISIACMLSSSADLICRYAKLETGSNFTGFVPLDYYNYGYNQGYQNGQGDLLGSRNYVLLDYLSFSGNTRNLTSDFVFNDINYVYGDYTEDLLSLYIYNNPNFAVIDSLDGAPSGSQVGYKYENENLYGDILLMMPYCDDNLRVVFEVVDSGEVLITSPRDTVHWSLNTHLGNVNGQASWSCDLYTIHFYSPTQVNIYFLPYQPLDYGNEAMYLPLNTKSWRIYSTQSNTALNDFDSGYLSGIKDGREQQSDEDATLIARARGQGYEEGRRDALEDTSDYTFMGLIGSVIDAPIASFRGLLNFSILGVNMQSFVLAILTLCVIIIVIKIALGGK